MELGSQLEAGGWRPEPGNWWRAGGRRGAVFAAAMSTERTAIIDGARDRAASRCNRGTVWALRVSGRCPSSIAVAAMGPAGHRH
jgi:hypothetical protein